MPDQTNPTDQALESAADEKREALRQAFAAYTEVLQAAVIVGGDEVKRHANVSLVQLEAAKRVLWMA